MPECAKILLANRDDAADVHLTTNILLD